MVADRLRLLMSKQTHVLMGKFLRHFGLMDSSWMSDIIIFILSLLQLDKCTSCFVSMATLRCFGFCGNRRSEQRMKVANNEHNMLTATYESVCFF